MRPPRWDQGGLVLAALLSAGEGQAFARGSVRPVGRPGGANEIRSFLPPLVEPLAQFDEHGRVRWVVRQIGEFMWVRDDIVEFLRGTRLQKYVRLRRWELPQRPQAPHFNNGRIVVLDRSSRQVRPEVPDVLVTGGTHCPLARGIVVPVVLGENFIAERRRRILQQQPPE